MRIDDIETDDHTTEDLLIIRIEWQAKIDHILAQLKEAKERWVMEDQKSDPNWMYNARRAASITMTNIKKLDIIIKYRNIDDGKIRQQEARQRKAKERATFENAFIDAAKERLDPDLFADLVKIARVRGS